MEAQRLQAQRLEAQRAEAQRLEAQRLETQRLEAQRLEAQRIAEAEAAAEAQRYYHITFPQNPNFGPSSFPPSLYDSVCQ